MPDTQSIELNKTLSIAEIFCYQRYPMQAVETEEGALLVNKLKHRILVHLTITSMENLLLKRAATISESQLTLRL